VNEFDLGALMKMQHNATPGWKSQVAILSKRVFSETAFELFL